MLSSLPPPLSSQSAPLPCHPTTTFAGDISAPKLTFRFGAAATHRRRRTAAATAATQTDRQTVIR